MNIKAVIFDVGHTLVYYNNHLNWQNLYGSAIKQVMKTCDFDYTKEADDNAQDILMKYNTRVNFREHEVSSDIIFSEILNSWRISTDKLQTAKYAFFSYFQRGAMLYEDTEEVLKSLRSCSIKTGILTDVAYGMDNEYSLSELAAINKYIDICLTSIDVGYRKPNVKGYQMLQKSFNILNSQIAFVGDEEKDIAGANNAGMISVLINRDDTVKNFYQHHTISSLSEVMGIIDS